MVNNIYYASSPVLLAKPPSLAASPRFVSRFSTPPPLNYIARPSNNNIAGRKRSRDFDLSEQDDHAEATDATCVIEVPAATATAAVALLPSATTIVTSATSLSSPLHAPTAARPTLVGRKSRCRAEHHANIPDMVNDDEEVDPLARQLGVGWKRLTENQQSAIAGTEALIQDKFDLLSPKVMLFHEGLSLYVVKSIPSGTTTWTQWWVFLESLNSCRLLCSDDTQLFTRLANKRLDHRGLWVPNICFQGPEVFAKNSTNQAPSYLTSCSQEPTNELSAAASSPACDSPMANNDGDVEMSF